MKKTKKRAALFALACAMVLSLASCGDTGSSEVPSDSEEPSSSEEVYEISIAHPTGEMVINHFLATCVKDILEEKSDGRLKVTIYPNAQLGTTREEIEGIINGTITSGTILTQLYTPFVPETAVLDMYNLWNDLDECRTVIDGNVLTALQEAYEAKGMKLFGHADSGWSYVSSNKEIRTLDDFAGFKIRSVENSVVMSYWSALGCNPTPVDYSELYIALQQGTVDGQENALDCTYGDGFYEVQKYEINLRHRISQISYVMNLDFYNSLPADLQAICDEWIPVACDNARQMTDDYAEEVRGKLEDAGLEFIDFSDSDMARVQELAEEAWSAVRETAGDEIVDLVLSEVEAYRAGQ